MSNLRLVSVMVNGQRVAGDGSVERVEFRFNGVAEDVRVIGERDVLGEQCGDGEVGRGGQQ